MMKALHLGTVVLAAGLLGSPAAYADYDSHPLLHPDNRCAAIPAGHEDPDDPGGVDSIHCQRLIWDLEPTTEAGAMRIGAAFAEDRIPRFPRGLIDRPPPMFVSADAAEGFETLNGFPECDEIGQPAGCRVRLCPEGEIPYWQEHLNEDGSPVIVTDGVDGDFGGKTGVDDDGNATGEPQSGPLFEVTCRRGVRTYLGPWQTGTGPDFDYLIPEQLVRFDNTAHLDGDADGGYLPKDGDGDDMRLEWNVMTEIYNHFSSHHMTCYLANTPGTQWERCNDPENPAPREAHQEPGVECDPGTQPACGECWTGYQEHADAGGACHSQDSDPRCPSASQGGPAGNGGFRNGTQVPGRLEVTLPPERGAATLEQQLWRCNHHVVSTLPPGSYGMDTRANYRLQKGGVMNTTGDEIFGTPDGEEFGGAVGEAVYQHLTESWLVDDPENPGEKKVARGSMNNMFNAVPDLATTYYAPFTWNYHTALWFPPFDLALTTTAIHAHHRMVKGTMDVVPANPLRPDSPDPACGGSKYGTSSHIYETWEWEDAQVCQYWKDPDGPIILRKGQAIATTCFVNNGVTPEAIKHGLVAGSVIQTIKEMGAPIPDYPELMPASTWGDILAESPVGDQLLYGTHPPINYRVVYKCAPEGLGSSLVLNNPVSYVAGDYYEPLGGSDVCSPNALVDADGDYIDGPYMNVGECGVDTDGDGERDEARWCEPSSIIFRCVGEDEMCIGVGAYYPLPRLGGPGHDEAMDSLAEGDIDNVGTPGATTNTDYVGVCQDCPDLVGP